MGNGASIDKYYLRQQYGVDIKNIKEIDGNYYLTLQRESFKLQNPVLKRFEQLNRFSREKEIDDKIREFAANWQWDRISVVERNILRIAVYEMLYALDVPPIVSINEAVSIARDYSNDRSCNFINGILNSIKDTLDRDGRTGAKK